MNLVGLTGGVACGKSTVARTLERHLGIPVVDADRAAREVVARGTSGLDQIVAFFGDWVLQGDGTLDRAALRRHIARDPQAKAQLEAITHPRIRARVGEQLAKLAARGTQVSVVEAALMVETGTHAHYDALLVVSCPPQVQVARLAARDGVSEEDARALIAAQLPLEQKERLATVVIRNDGDLPTLEEATIAAWEEVRRHLGLDEPA